MNNGLFGNKYLYKIFLMVVKYLPLTQSLIQMILTTLNYFGIHALWLTYFGGSSLLFIILLFVISYAFKYCDLFRIPLYYNLSILTLGYLRIFNIISLDTLWTYRVIVIISGIFIVLYIIIAYKNRNNPKIDHIKEFCKRYGCCS